MVRKQLAARRLSLTIALAAAALVVLYLASHARTARAITALPLPTPHAPCPSPRHFDPVHWVHFPKTGTSFAFSLYAAFCGAVPDDHLFPTVIPPLQRHRFRFIAAAAPQAAECHARFAFLRPGHHPLPRFAENDTERRAPVAMFRAPPRRLESAFYHDYHAFGMDPDVREEMLRYVGGEGEVGPGGAEGPAGGEGPVGNDSTGDASAAANPSTPNPSTPNPSSPNHTHPPTPRDKLERFAQFPGVKGCMTKMLLGIMCARNSTLSGNDVARAVRRVHGEFAFVGITDAYDASVCLLHCLVKDGHPLQPFERINVRKRAEGPDDEDLLDDQRVARALHDHIDGPVYRAAVRRFLSDWDRLKTCSASRCECMKEHEDSVEALRTLTYSQPSD